MYSSVILFALCNLLYLSLHVTGSGSFPKPLSAKEEAQCLLRIREGDEEARSILIEHNLRLVAHIIKKYYASLSDQDDLISIGTIGLIKAVSTFDYDKGTRFATYASRCIENEILMYFRRKKKSASDLSISDPIDTDKDGNAITLQDIMADEDNVLDQIDLQFEDNAAVCVVLASGGYPVSYEKGFPIEGLENLKGRDGVYVFHAGTRKENGRFVTNGGRVLGVTATGPDLKAARANAYEAVKQVSFEKAYCRSDIGKAIDEA